MDICVALSRILPIPIEKPECVVIIDVVRSGTSCATAMKNSAREIQMYATIEDTLEAAQKYSEGEYLLCGERGSSKIEGFHLGNSPAEYSEDTVKGKIILISTTNGPAAFEQYMDAKCILSAAWVNVSATCKYIRDLAPESLAIICAGTFGLVSTEDVICAGAIISELQSKANLLDDGCSISLDAYENYGRDEVFLRELPTMEGGRRLSAKNMQSDFIPCTTRDSVDFALVYDAKRKAFFRAGQEEK